MATFLTNRLNRKFYAVICDLYLEMTSENFRKLQKHFRHLFAFYYKKYSTKKIVIIVTLTLNLFFRRFFMDTNYLLLVLLISIFTSATDTNLNTNTNFLLLLLLALNGTNTNCNSCCNQNNQRLF